MSLRERKVLEIGNHVARAHFDDEQRECVCVGVCVKGLTSVIEMFTAKDRRCAMKLPFHSKVIYDRQRWVDCWGEIKRVMK